MPFFEFYLKGKGPLKHPKAWVFQTGTNRWRQFAAWPPKEARPKAIFLRAGGRLAFDPPADAKPEACYDEYVSDPAKPVPYLNKIAIGMSPEYMVEDQRFAATRPDVLVYQTEALEEDLAVAGPIQVELHVATSGTDADWIVKLIDVYPDDYPDPSPQPRRRAHGRLPATGARRRDARQVPQQLREARAVLARPADPGAVHAAGRVPHVPPRSPADGAGPEHVVPAG